MENNNQLSEEYEIARIPKTKNVCPMCENYAKDQSSKPTVIMCCEGACLRGEIARRAANLICHQLIPEQTVRICLGGAFTKSSGQRRLVKNGKRVIAIEGCFIECASRTMKGVIPDLNTEIVYADDLYDFDTNLFGIDEMPEDEIKKHAQEVAEKVVEMLI